MVQLTHYLCAIQLFTNLTISGLISLEDFLQSVKQLGVRSLMVEGGAKIIQSFLTERQVDTIIVTIAPTLVGADGVGYESGLIEQVCLFLRLASFPDH